MALLSNCVAIYLISVRYKFIINLMGRKLSVFNSLVVMIVSQLTTYIVPFKLGPILTKPHLTKKYSDATLNQSIAATVFEQFCELFFQIFLLLFILIFLFNKDTSSTLLFQSELVIAAIFISVTVFVLLRRKAITFIWGYRHMAPKILKRLAKKLNLSHENMQIVADESLEYFTKPKVILMFLFFSIMLFFIIPMILKFCVLAYSGTITYYKVFLIYWVSMIVGRLSGIPGGFGSRDLTMGGLLVFYGVPAYDGLQIVIWQRIVSLIPYFVIGAPLLYYYSKDVINSKLQNPQ